LKPHCHVLLSNFGFTFILRRYAEVPAALRLCLTVGRTPEGADLLQGLGLVGQVADLCAALSQSPYFPLVYTSPGAPGSGGRGLHTSTFQINLSCV
jgi:hypothetical protein